MASNKFDSQLKVYSEIVTYVPSFLNFSIVTGPCCEMSKESCHLFQIKQILSDGLVTYLVVSVLAVDQGSNNIYVEI